MHIWSKIEDIKFVQKVVKTADRGVKVLEPLNEHLKTVHENIKGFSCEVCHKAFGWKQNLDYHVKLVHEKIKAFDCSICKTFFGRRSSLNTHVKTVHGNY